MKAKLIACLAVLALTSASAAPEDVSITALSTDPSRVTGGDVLVQVRLKADTTYLSDTTSLKDKAFRVVAAGKDVTSVFKPGAERFTLVGLVTGLPLGKSTITVEIADRAAGQKGQRSSNPTADRKGPRNGSGETSRNGAARNGRARASLDVTNYPITGPVFSGPWIQPFICQTESFALPDGSKLGPSIDANCSARTVVNHVYLPKGDKAVFKPLPRTIGVMGRTAYLFPEDVAMTTTTAGVTVPFVVRVETGTMNRGIYQNLVLHDPTVDPEPTPFTPPKGWNHRLAALHGVGCPTGWYVQGAAMGVNPLDPVRLGQGYAIFINTLNHPTNSCNAVLAGETTMMGKEHFIETFGVPEFTISTGASGGAYTSLQVADAFPGLIDGININGTFPDALSIALAGLDGRLLMRYFTMTPNDLTEAQKVAVSGYHSMKAFLDAANQSQRTDPVLGRKDIDGYQAARWNDAVPVAMRYDAVTNPKGARPTVFDAARNIYGVNPSTGAALRPFDNVGVQYGLNALNAGVITPAQFIELNEKIGGFDSDANPVGKRTVGDANAIKRTYQSGLLLGGGGGLANIPIVDNASSNDTAGYHYGWFHYALRERLRQANGSSANMVMWRSTTPAQAAAVFDEWMQAYAADRAAGSRRDKAIRTRPKWAADGCYDQATPAKLLTEELLFSAKPTSKCTELYPVYSSVRVEAGGPLAANVLKCQLAPVDPQKYKVPMTPAEVERLKAIFPGGVCDWTKPGVNQMGVVPWASWR